MTFIIQILKNLFLHHSSRLRACQAHFHFINYNVTQCFRIKMSAPNVENVAPTGSATASIKSKQG